MSSTSNRNENEIKPKKNSLNGSLLNFQEQASVDQKPKNSKRRNRTIYPPLEKNYGPKATLKKVTEDYLLLIQDPLSQQLSWTKPPLYVLVIKKIGDALFEPFIKILKNLIFEHNLITYVEESDYENEILKSDLELHSAIRPFENNKKPSLRKFCFTPDMCKSLDNTDKNKIDFVICIGGDGTLLHASGLFQKSCPPIISIHLGSLGFLCPFDFENYKEYINGVIKGGVPLLLRNRLKCKLEKSNEKVNDTTQNQSDYLTDCLSKQGLSNKNEEINLYQELICLNEIVVGRGCSPFLSNLDLYINDYLITTVQGDGLIISSPTGSTAYAMAAGASMCHPSVQSMIIAPICPHSLSFRPIVVPAGVELKIALSPDSRHTAWFSVDGRNTTELKQGFFISITTSEYPLPTISRSDQINDWFEGLATCLHWNQRQKQLPLNQCYMQSQQNQSQLTSNHSSTSSLKQSNNSSPTAESNEDVNTENLKSTKLNFY